LHSADTKVCRKSVHSKLSLFFSVPQKITANRHCTSRLESVKSLPVADQANCAPCLALSESVCQRPHGGFGLMLRTPAKMSSVYSSENVVGVVLRIARDFESTSLVLWRYQKVSTALSSLQIAPKHIKDPKETFGSRRRQEQRAEVQLRELKIVFDKDAYGAILQQGSKRDSPGRRRTKQLPARPCLQESCDLLRMKDARPKLLTHTLLSPSCRLSLKHTAQVQK